MSLDNTPSYSSNKKSKSVKDLNQDVTDVMVINKENATDRFHLCSLYIIVFGITVLLPSSAMNTATFYFLEKLGDREDLKNIFTSTLNISSNIPKILSYFINTFFIYKYNRVLRVYISLFMMLFGFASIIIFVPIDVSGFRTEFFVATMLSSVLLSIFSSIGIAAFFATFSYFPHLYILHFLLGEAFAGILVNIIKIAITGSDYSSVVSVSLFFGSAIFSIIFCILCFYLFSKNKYYKHRIAHSIAAKEKKEIKVVSVRKSFSIYRKIFKQMWIPISVIFSNFTITLMYFPGLPLAARSVETGTAWADDYFTTVYCFLLFNFSDALGKELPLLTPKFKGNSILLLVLTLARIAFLPFYLIVNKSNNSLIPNILNHDAAPIIINFLFGITNGYYSSIAFNDAPKLVKPEHTEMANTLTVFILGLGLASGSFLSYAFNRLVYF